jgi:hypothetical protein
LESRDSIANADPSQIDQIAIRIQSTSDPTGKELLLQETSPNSAIFVGALDLVSGPSSASDELVVAPGDSIVASRESTGLQSTAVVRGAVGSLISGSHLGDTFVAAYTGTGATNQWNVTRNGQTIFAGTLSIDASLWIEGLEGNDSLLVDAGSYDNQIVYDANRITVDGFSILVSRIEKVKIAGGAGNDRLTLGNAVAEFDGGIGTDRLQMVSGNRLWNIIGAGNGSVDSSIPFSSVEWALGGTGNDSFVFASAGTMPGGVAGGDGTDVIDLSVKSSTQTINLAGGRSSSFGAMSEVERIVGGLSKADQLLAPNTANQWTLNGIDSGVLNGVLGFESFENLTGGSAADQFQVAGSATISGTVNGAGGIDQLDLSARQGGLEFRVGSLGTIVGIIAAFRTIEQVVGNSDIETFLRGSDTATAWAITASGQIVVGGVTYSSVGSIVGGTGIDTLTGPAAANRWTLSGANEGTWQTGASVVRFRGVENLTGSSSVDTFVVESSGTLTGTINGGTGVDELNVSARAGALDFRLGTVASLVGVLGGYTLVEQVVGNGVSGSQVVGANVATSWSTTVSGQIVVGGVTYSSVGSVVGGTGIDTLTGPAAANDWTVMGGNAGLIRTGTAVVSFSGVENLVGNTSVDQFRMEVLGSLTGSLQGGAGVNSLSYAGWTNAVVVNLASTLAGNATAISGVVSAIQVVLGGAGNDILTASSVASVLVGLGGDDQLTGGGQRDLLIGGIGADRLVANAGDDILISGTAVFEENVSALRDIHAEWTSARTFDQRIANLMGIGSLPRLNGENYLNNDAADGIVDTVFADVSSDSLTGGSQQDWFFADLSEVVDLVASGTSPDRRTG